MAVAVITLGTIVLAFIAGELWDYTAAVAKLTSLNALELLEKPLFWSTFIDDFIAGFGAIAGQFALALGLGALGCFGTIRRNFAKASATDSRAAQAGIAPAYGVGGHNPNTPNFGSISPAGPFPSITPAAPEAAPIAGAAPVATAPAPPPPPVPQWSPPFAAPVFPPPSDLR